MFKTLTSALLFTLVFVGIAHAEPNAEATAKKEKTVRATDKALQANFKKLEKYLDFLAENDKLMGSLALRENGEIIFAHQFGYMDVASKKAPNIDTKYQIGSISKTYTAAMIMQLVEKGQLKLTDPLDKYFPQVPNAQKITIHHLLNHESGLFNFTNDPAYMEYMTQKQSRKELLDRIVKFEIEFEPGEKNKYSNTNYVLLSFIIEDITKTTFSDALKKQITKPLKLTRTDFGNGITIEDNEAHSYKYSGQWLKDVETNMSIPTGAGAISASPADVTQFFHALFHGQVVKEESLRKMIKPKSYGYALAAMPFYEKTSYGHGGQIDSFSSIAGYIEEDKLAIAFFSNGVNMVMNDAMIAILSAYYDKPFEIPAIEEKEPVGDYDLNDYVGFYSSKQIPLKINIFIQGDTLMAQATGQGAFPLTATAKDEFSFAPAGIEMRFNIKNNSFNLHQGGGVMLFTQEEKADN